MAAETDLVEKGVGLGVAGADAVGQRDKAERGRQGQAARALVHAGVGEEAARSVCW